MSFWLADKSVTDLLEEIRDEYHPHLMEARIAVLFSDKRKVSGNMIILGCMKKVSGEDKVLSNFDFKMVLSAMDWAELGSKQKRALIDHELSHADVERVKLTEMVGGRKKPVKDEHGRVVYTQEIKYDDDTGRPKFKTKGHDFENFAHIAKRYGVEVAEVIGGYFPAEIREPETQTD